MLARKFNRLITKNFKTEKPIRKDVPKEEHTRDRLICYDCKRPGNTKYECLTKRNTKKKAMMVTWSDSDDSQDEKSDEIANLCFMALDDYKVYPIPHNLDSYIYK